MAGRRRGPGTSGPGHHPCAQDPLLRAVSRATTIAIVAPCYNEGDVAVRFVQEVEGVLRGMGHKFIVVMVDDGSLDGTLAMLKAVRTTAPNVELRVLELDCNMGQQAAIAQGLHYAAGTDAERFVVMDADGEDDPAALSVLCAIEDVSVVLVNRGRRHEGLAFRIGYALYRFAFRAITRRRIAFGNYSMVDRRVLRVALDRGFVHYAAFLSRLRVRTRMIVHDRRPRFDGRSKVGFQGLGLHAFRSLIEYGEELLAVLLKGFILLGAASVLSIGAILCIRLFTSLAVPGWASLLSVSLFNSTLLCLGFLTMGLWLANAMQRRANRSAPMYKVH